MSTQHDGISWGKMIKGAVRLTAMAVVGVGIIALAGFGIEAGASALDFTESETIGKIGGFGTGVVSAIGGGTAAVVDALGGAYTETANFVESLFSGDEVGPATHPAEVNPPAVAEATASEIEPAQEITEAEKRDIATKWALGGAAVGSGAVGHALGRAKGQREAVGAFSERVLKQRETAAMAPKSTSLT